MSICRKIGIGWDAYDDDDYDGQWLSTCLSWFFIIFYTHKHEHNYSQIFKLSIDTQFFGFVMTAARGRKQKMYMIFIVQDAFFISVESKKSLASSISVYRKITRKTRRILYSELTKLRPKFDWETAITNVGRNRFDEIH